MLSVHTVVSFDFASSVLPGWHATIFPPYFVAGAIYSGFAMVLTLAIPHAQHLRPAKISSPMRHLDNMAKVMLATGLIVLTATSWKRSSPGTAANPYEAVHDLEPHDGPVRAGRTGC